jgi:hypothetical protein
MKTIGCTVSFDEHPRGILFMAAGCGNLPQEYGQAD